MYRINVLSTGKYNNVVTGIRYLLFKRNVKDFIISMKECDCEYKLEKFRKLHFGTYSWTTYLTDKERKYFFN